MRCPQVPFVTSFQFYFVYLWIILKGQKFGDFWSCFSVLHIFLKWFCSCFRLRQSVQIACFLKPRFRVICKYIHIFSRWNLRLNFNSFFYDILFLSRFIMTILQLSVTLCLIFALIRKMTTLCLIFVLRQMKHLDFFRIIWLDPFICMKLEPI